MPDYWIPLLPVKDGATLRLKRGVLPAFGEGGIQGLQLPKGRLLEPNRELLLHEEEVPREGARDTPAKDDSAQDDAPSDQLAK